MKTLLLALVIASNFLTAAPSYAATLGNSSGGGGDATEVRVNEIRSDLLNWIEKGGAKELNFPADLSYGEYVDEMSAILKPKKVVVAFTEEKILVNKVEKTCRGFFAGSPSQPNILCNISRFKNTLDSEQYKLVHHEFAGLVGVEKNEGAASDYAISLQITDYLQVQTVLKLAVKKLEFKVQGTFLETKKKVFNILNPTITVLGKKYSIGSNLDTATFACDQLGMEYVAFKGSNPNNIESVTIDKDGVVQFYDAGDSYIVKILTCQLKNTTTVAN
jgi:hypothetical protein